MGWERVKGAPAVGGDGQQRVVAPLAGIAVVAGALLGQSVGLADGGIEVDGERRVAGSGPSGPGPGQQLPAHPVELTDVAPPEAAQEGAQGGWRLDRAAQGAGRPPGAQHIGVVNAVAPSQRRRPQPAQTPPASADAPSQRRRPQPAQTPPASADATSVIILSLVFARPGASPRSRRCRTSSGRPRCRACADPIRSCDGRAWMDVRFSITIRQHKSLHNLIEAIPEDAWTPIPYWMDGATDVAETICTPFQAEADAAPVRLIVRRVKPTPGSQLALFAKYSYHGFITDRDGELLELEADHRRHAEIENAIRDLKYGVGLNHLPSGRFAANGAWLAVQTMAHNLARWTARIGLGEQVVTTKTLRRRFFSLAGRITRSARRLTLHLPQRWPWEAQFDRALARLRALPLPA